MHIYIRNDQKWKMNIEFGKVEYIINRNVVVNVTLYSTMRISGR